MEEGRVAGVEVGLGEEGTEEAWEREMSRASEAMTPLEGVVSLTEIDR